MLARQRPFRISLSAGLVAATLAPSCSLMLTFEETPSEVFLAQPKDAGTDASTAGSGPDEPPSNGGGAGSAGEAGEAGVGGSGQGGGPPAPIADAGADAEPADASPDLPDAIPPRKHEPVVWLAFIEDPAEREAELEIVDVRAALRPGATADSAAWRRNLRPSLQTGNALDFAWSPDGRRLALRYEAIDAARIAIFEAPDWTELPVADFATPATDPLFAVTQNYQWSPDGAALAAVLTSGAGQFVTVFSLDATRGVPLSPVGVSSGFESMAWFSPSTLFLAQADVAGQEIVTLTIDGRALRHQQLSAGLTLFPLKLRRVKAGILGAAQTIEAFAYFWRYNAELGLPGAYTGDSYGSAGHDFVAETSRDLGSAAIFSIQDVGQPLDVVPDCPEVLAWVEGPVAGSLTSARIACFGTELGLARVIVYSHDSEGSRSAIRLDDETLLADLASRPAWEGHARAFSPNGEFLSLATAAHDFLIDLRTSAPRSFVNDATGPGATAFAFAPSGRQLFKQRGAAMLWTYLGDFPIPLMDGQAPGPMRWCDEAHHLTTWCGSPGAAALASGGWHSTEDVLAMLSLERGLTIAALTEELDGVEPEDVSTCGPGCVTSYEFSPP